MTDREIKILRREGVRQEMDKFKKSNQASYSRLFLSILLILSLLLLFVSLFRKANNGSDISFASFLDWLSNLNTFQFNVNIQDFFIYGNWGVFDFLRNFFNIFTGLFGVIVYLFSNLLNLFIYLTQFIVFLYS